jgi:hypothetical protein
MRPRRDERHCDTKQIASQDILERSNTLFIYYLFFIYHTAMCFPYYLSFYCINLPTVLLYCITVALST